MRKGSITGKEEEVLRQTGDNVGQVDGDNGEDQVEGNDVGKGVEGKGKVVTLPP